METANKNGDVAGNNGQSRRTLNAAPGYYITASTGLTPMQTNDINNKYKTLQLFEIDD